MAAKIVRITKEVLWAFKNLANFPTYITARRYPFASISRRIKFKNGVTFFLPPDTGDAGMINEIWHNEVYDKHLSAITDNSTVLDIGANIGVFSVKAALAAKNVNVLAFEPVLANIHALKANAAWNGCGARISAIRSAVTDKSGEVDMYVDRENAEAALIKTVPSIKITVHSMTLADALRGVELCAFMKMDCEGAEEAVMLKTPDEVILKIDAMAIEWHNPTSLPDIMQRLSRLGYLVEYDGATRILNASII